MKVGKKSRRRFIRDSAILSMAGLLPVPADCPGEEGQSRRDLREPLLRTPKTSTKEKPSKDDANATHSRDVHPLDEAIRIAENALEHMRRDIDDYKCVMIKRERVSGRLGERQYMFAKIRNRKVVDGRTTVPFSVYLYFTKPDSLKGRECCYIEGKNNGKLAVKEPGIAGKLLPIVWLAPDSILAMRGNLYPITEAGIENLIVKLLEKATRDRKRDECQVVLRDNAKVNDRKCQLVEVIHPHRRAYFEFNLAHIYIDLETKLPIRYAAYTWPKSRDQNPNPKPDEETLFEEYTYINLELNPGLGDTDFVVS